MTWIPKAQQDRILDAAMQAFNGLPEDDDRTIRLALLAAAGDAHDLASLVGVFEQMLINVDRELKALGLGGMSDYSPSALKH